MTNYDNMEKKTVVQVPAINKAVIPGIIIYQVIAGDHLTGVFDHKTTIKTLGIYVAWQIDVYAGDYKSIVTIEDNHVFYELSYFMKLVQKGSNIPFEMLFAPTNYVVIANSSIRDEILNSKLGIVTKAFGNFIVERARKCVGDTVMTEKHMIEMLGKIDEYTIPITDYIYMRSNDLGSYSLTKPIPWKEFMRNVRDRYSNPKNFAVIQYPYTKNHYDLFYDVSGNRFCNGIVIDNEIVHINRSDIGRFEKAKGMLIFDRQRYEKDVKKYTIGGMWKEFNSIKRDIKVEKWKRDMYKKDVHYQADEIATCMRLLDTAIQFYDKKILKIHRGNDLKGYDSIRKGEQPYEELLMVMLNSIKTLHNHVENSTLQQENNEIFLKMKVKAIRDKCYFRQAAVRKSLASNEGQDTERSRSKVDR